MEYKITFTKEADKDLDNIREHIWADSEKTALRVVMEITKNIDLLKTMPSIGRAGQVLRTRELVITKYPYIVAYQVRDNVVYILRILHTSRKWDEII